MEKILAKGKINGELSSSRGGVNKGSPKCINIVKDKRIEKMLISWREREWA